VSVVVDPWRQTYNADGVPPEVEYDEDHGEQLQSTIFDTTELFSLFFSQINKI
jgi:hypothetical protein